MVGPAPNRCHTPPPYCAQRKRGIRSSSGYGARWKTKLVGSRSGASNAVDRSADTEANGSAGTEADSAAGTRTAGCRQGPGGQDRGWTRPWVRASGARALVGPVRGRRSPPQRGGEERRRGRPRVPEPAALAGSAAFDSPRARRLGHGLGCAAWPSRHRRGGRHGRRCCGGSLVDGDRSWGGARRVVVGGSRCPRRGDRRSHRRPGRDGRMTSGPIPIVDAVFRPGHCILVEPERPPPGCRCSKHRSEHRTST